MSKYRCEGTYSFEGRQHPFISTFDIDSDGRIIGEMYDPPESPDITHNIAGRIRLSDHGYILTFLKNPREWVKANISYVLKKEEGDGFEGEYRGMWQLAEKGTKGLIHTYDPESGKDSWLSIPPDETSNTSELRLSLI